MNVQIEVEIVHCLLSIVLPAFTESCCTVWWWGGQRVFECVGGAGLGQQSATEHTPLPGEGVVQRVVGVVQYGQQFVQGPSFCHCHQRVQLCAQYWASSPCQSVQSAGVSLLAASSPANHSIKEDPGHHRLLKTSTAVFCRCFLLKDLSLLMKYRCLYPFLCKVSIFAVQYSLSSSCSPRYL